MTTSEIKINFAKIFVEKIFNDLNKNNIKDDSFNPFLANMETEPRVVASALAMSYLPYFTKKASKTLLKEYNETYNGGFYGSAIMYFDDKDIPSEFLKHKKLFTDGKCVKTIKKREKLQEICPDLFKILDEWTKSCMNGDSLAGCYGRHCITTRFEDNKFSIAYNKISEDECGSLAVTERKDDIVLFEKLYTDEEIQQIYADKNVLSKEIDRIWKQVKKSSVLLEEFFIIT